MTYYTMPCFITQKLGQNGEAIGDKLRGCLHNTIFVKFNKFLKMVSM